MAGVDGFFIPTPLTAEELAIRERREGKRDFSLFTLDYAFRSVGGRQAAIELARLAAGTNERLKGLVEAYDELPTATRKNKGKLLESLCISNQIDPSEFLGICCAVAHRYQLDTSGILASVELANVVAAGLEQAKMPGGIADRKLIYEHSLFVQPKGPGVAVQINNTPAGVGMSLPEFRSLSEIALQAISRAALPPAKEETYIDAELIPA